MPWTGRPFLGDARQRRNGLDRPRRLQVGRPSDRRQQPRCAADQGGRRRRARRRRLAQAVQGGLDAVADARHSGDADRDEPRQRRRQGDRRRLRLLRKPVQPRAAGVAPARFRIQAVRVFGGARQRRNARDDLHGRAARLRGRESGNDVSAEERRFALQRPHTAARSALSVDQPGIDPRADGRRSRSGSRLRQTIRFRHHRFSAQHAAGDRRRHHGRHPDANGPRLRDVRERRLSRRAQHPERGAQPGRRDDLQGALSRSSAPNARAGNAGRRGSANAGCRCQLERRRSRRRACSTKATPSS